MDYANKSKFMVEELKEMERDLSRPSKRKRVVLSLEVNTSISSFLKFINFHIHQFKEKLEVIKVFDSGLNFESVGKQFNIGTTTVKDIIGRREKIEQAVNKHRHFGLSRKVLKEGKKPAVEEELYSYIVQKSEQGQRITNRDILDVASVLNAKIYQEAWTPSKGWLGKFKARYSLNINSPPRDDLTLIVEENKNVIESNEIEVENPSTSNVQGSSQTSKINVINATDVLLDFMHEHDFPLKEIITLKIIRDKIGEMPEAHSVLYEVLQQQNTRNEEEEIAEEETMLDEDVLNEIVFKSSEDDGDSENKAES